MKAFLLVSLLGAFALAQTTTSICQCPLIKCPSSNAAELCRCLNSRETMCQRACPMYKPTYMPCPVNPPTPSPTPEVQVEPTCTCEPGFCIQVWPQSCYCGNAQKQHCFEKCGGVKPELQECPPMEMPSLVTRAVEVSPPKPTNMHKPCGGGRGNYRECDYGEVCIKDPYKDGCGPACDQVGICVKDKLCGGFGGFACDVKDQVCEDDPRDDCDPLNYGNDCGGLCVWPLSLRHGCHEGN
ncbi:hypothetical protein PMIN06_002620 [Paraphaeosphaeria minitans]